MDLGGLGGLGVDFGGIARILEGFWGGSRGDLGMVLGGFGWILGQFGRILG